LQQAYYSESALAGGWTLIGYTAPNDGTTTNFKYVGSLAAKATTDQDKEGAWSAQNIAKLNDCKNDKAHWVVNLKAVSDGADAYEAAVVEETSGECTALTPTFSNIGK